MRAAPEAPHSPLWPCPSIPQTPAAAPPGAGGFQHPLHGHSGSCLEVLLWGGLQERAPKPEHVAAEASSDCSLPSKSLPFSFSLWLWCSSSASGELCGAGTRGSTDKVMLSVQVALPR